MSFKTLGENDLYVKLLENNIKNDELFNLLKKLNIFGKTGKLWILYKDVLNQDLQKLIQFINENKNISDTEIKNKLIFVHRENKEMVIYEYLNN